MKMNNKSLITGAAKLARCVSTNSKQCTQLSAEISKRDDYYKHIGEMKINTDYGKPQGWDEALPYEAIPGPKGLPIIGNLWRFLPKIGDYFGLDVLEQQQKLHREHGKIATLGNLLGRKYIFVCDSGASEALLRNEGVWPIRYGMSALCYYRTVIRKDVFQELGGLLALQGKEWFDLRSTVNPILMQPRTAAQYVSNMDNIANQLVEKIKLLAASNQESEMPADFINELYKWSLESIVLIAVNKNLGCLKTNLTPDSDPQRLINSVLRMFELSFKMDVMPPVWKYISTPSWKQFVNAMDTITFILKKYIDEGIDRAHQSSSEGRSVLERLVKIEKKVALTIAMDLMTAGIDTTGRTMGAALYFLARHPEKQDKLRNELRRILPSKDSEVTKDLLNEAQYLRAVIKETTRISPIAVGVLRSSIKDMVLCGYQIPKGTQVLINNLLLSHSEESFPRPKEFIPERYLRSTTDELSYKKCNQFASLPFGFGPRSCIGKRLANLELEVGIAKVIRNFELSWPHEDMVFNTTYLHGIARSLKLRVKELSD